MGRIWKKNYVLIAVRYTEYIRNFSFRPKFRFLKQGCDEHVFFVKGIFIFLKRQNF